VEETKMAIMIGKELPGNAFALLQPEDHPSKRGKVVQIVTVDGDGWPDAGMVSTYDIVARTPSNLRLATWGDGECANDLRLNGKLAMLIIDKDMTYYVKATAQEIAGASHGLSDINNQGGESPVAIFDVQVEKVFEDKIPTARVVSGVIFKGSDSEDQAHQSIFKQLLEA
jgi:hypothetical protein